MKKYAILLLTAVTVFAVSCDKEETISMRTRFITQGTWRYDATVVSSAGGDTNITGQMPAGVLTNVYRFDKTKDFFVLPTVPSGSVQVAEAKLGTWTFQQADTRMILTDTLFGGDYDVIQLDDTAMILSKRYTADGADSTAVLRRRFKRAS